jgi:hypothetical protein
MIKNKILFLFLSVLLIVGVIYFLKREKPSPSVSQKKSSPAKETHIIDEVNLKFDGKRVMGLPPGKERDSIRNLRVSNRPSDNWKPNLEKALIAQGGSAVKDVQIEKVDSFIWTESRVALYVETVKITLKNDKNSSVSFNAMIDSETGKILKNWNQPVIDHFDKKDNFKVHIDPRYLND